MNPTTVNPTTGMPTTGMPTPRDLATVPPKSRSRILGQWLAAIVPNPYQPPQTHGEQVGASRDDTRFIAPIRWDKLSAAAIAVSALSAVAIWLYHTQRTGVIGDPILLPLALKSAVWIPIYRMSTPLLMLVMPDDCRRPFGVFFLLLGILCCVHDFSIHFGAFPPLNGPVALGVALVLCVLAAFIQLGRDAWRSERPLRGVAFAAGWMGVMLSIELSFFGLTYVL